METSQCRGERRRRGGTEASRERRKRERKKSTQKEETENEGREAGKMESEETYKHGKEQRERKKGGKKRRRSSRRSRRSIGKPSCITNTKEATTLEPHLRLGMNKTPAAPREEGDLPRQRLTPKAAAASPTTHKLNTDPICVSLRGLRGRQDRIYQPAIEGQDNKKGPATFWQRRVTGRLQRCVYIALASTSVTPRLF